MPGPLSETALGAILIARSAYIETDDYGIPDWQAVIETHTAEGTPERAAWLAHLTAVIDAVKEEKNIPEPPAIATGSTVAISGGKRQKKSAAPVPGAPEFERDQRHAQIRAQRILDLEGAPAEGEVGPARAKQVGRRRDKVVDNLIIEEDELNSKQKLVKVVYCIACDQRTVYRNPQRIKEHAFQCTKLAELFPNLYEDSVKANAERGNGVAPSSKLRTKQKQGIIPGNLRPAMEVDQPNTEAGSSTADSNIKEYFAPKKLSDARQAALQAALDIALFQLVICAALPFSFVENPWLINLLFIAAPSYITPDRSAFFIRLITEQLSAFMVALKAFLAARFYLTLSFDGWSSRAHDEIYTFHTTLPSRRSFLTAGHVFKGVSVTAAALCDVVEKRIFASFKAKSYSALARPVSDV
ncbi:hypothetical protein K438DRAFT_1762979 [Mycena galopus ATCC 62051]|nr:hypothetical protein K438DRAFT_1762979 [Mycena galopus ATCC 62051]